MTPRFKRLSLATAVALLLTACGGGDDAATPEPSAALRPGDAVTLSVRVEGQAPVTRQLVLHGVTRQGQLVNDPAAADLMPGALVPLDTTADNERARALATPAAAACSAPLECEHYQRMWDEIAALKPLTNPTAIIEDIADLDAEVSSLRLLTVVGDPGLSLDVLRQKLELTDRLDQSEIFKRQQFAELDSLSIIERAMESNNRLTLLDSITMADLNVRFAAITELTTKLYSRISTLKSSQIEQRLQSLDRAHDASDLLPSARLQFEVWARTEDSADFGRFVDAYASALQSEPLIIRMEEPSVRPGKRTRLVPTGVETDGIRLQRGSWSVLQANQPIEDTRAQTSALSWDDTDTAHYSAGLPTESQPVEVRLDHGGGRLSTVRFKLKGTYQARHPSLPGSAWMPSIRVEATDINPGQDDEWMPMIGGDDNDRLKLQARAVVTDVVNAGTADNPMPVVTLQVELTVNDWMNSTAPLPITFEAHGLNGFSVVSR